MKKFEDRIVKLEQRRAVARKRQFTHGLARQKLMDRLRPRPEGSQPPTAQDWVQAKARMAERIQRLDAEQPGSPLAAGLRSLFDLFDRHSEKCGRLFRQL